MAEARTLRVSMSVDPEKLDNFNEAVLAAREAVADLNEKVLDVRKAISDLEFVATTESKPLEET